MAVYYNGKEVKDTSKLSGMNLSGKTSIKLGGRTVSITISTPPVTPKAYRFTGSSGSSGTTGYSDSDAACFFGPQPGQGEFMLFGDENAEFVGNPLFEDNQLTKPPRSIPNGYYFCFDLNMSVELLEGVVVNAIRCR